MDLTEDQLEQLRQALERLTEAATDFLSTLKSTAALIRDAHAEMSHGYPKGYGIDV